MSIEIPYDLINQVQSAVLKEVNFSSYDPDDASFPGLLSLESSISEIDPSPPYLRCKHCKGRLLRSVNSLICVFCGKQVAPQDTPPEPINFKTTFGCRWLLESLGLDGSEIVALPAEDKESNRGQKVEEEEFPLSYLLDLEITWNPEFDKLWTESNESSLNQAGVNPDYFLAERNRDDASAMSVEQFLPTKNDNGSGNNDTLVRDNHSLFENAQHSETAARSTGDDSGSGSFGGWEADFHSASAGTSHGESKSVDPVVGPSVDLSVHMDAVFGSVKSFRKDKEDIVSSGSKTYDWLQDDLYSSSNSGISDQSKQAEVTADQSKQAEVTANEKDGRTVQDANTSSSTSVDWIQGGRWQTESNKVPDNKTADNEDDSFDSWNDFPSSATAERLSEEQTGRAMAFEENLVVKDGGNVENTNNSSSGSVDRFQNDQLQPISITTPDSNAIVEGNDAFDVWNDFASSTTAQDAHNRQSNQIKQFEVTNNVEDGKTAENANNSSLDVDWFQNNQLQTNSKNTPDDKTVDGNDDFFNAWNDFTSSTSTQDPSEKQTGQINLFEATATIKDGGRMETAIDSRSVAWFQDGPTMSNKTPDNKATNEGNDLFDSWNDFTRSNPTQDSMNKQARHPKDFEVNTNVKDGGIMGVSNYSFDWFQGDQWQTSSNRTPVNKAVNEVYDSFDDWNDFTGSTSAQDPSDKESVNHITPSVEQTSEINLLATSNNLQNVDFGRLTQPNIFLGASINQNGSAQVNIMTSEPLAANRIPDVNAEDGENSGEAAKGDVSSATRSTTDAVETLISQMHDLSFMLASDLSIPPKQDGFNSNI